MLMKVAEVLPSGVLDSGGGGGEVGSWLVANPDVDKIRFTGSRIAANAARTPTPTTMEPGGNDAAIVRPDADPKDMASA